MRLSTLFTCLYKDYKLAFETGLIQDELTDFSPLLCHELTKRPIEKPHYPQISEESEFNKKPALFHASLSPLSEVLGITKGELPSQAQMTSMHANTSVSIDHLFIVLNATKQYGTNTTLPPNGELVPIINLANIEDEALSFFLSMFVDFPTDTALTRSEMLEQLSQFVPYSTRQQSLPKPSNQSNCASCGVKFNIFNWVHFNCSHCRVSLCINCPVRKVMISRLSNKPSLLCHNCLVSFNKQDVDDWTSKCVECIEIGTLGYIKAALVCLTIALCLSDFSSKPVIKAAQAFVQQDMPELAMSFVSIVLEHSKDPKDTMKMYVLCGQIFKALADQTGHSSETQWNLLLAAKESCNLALEMTSYLDSSVEPPAILVPIHREIIGSLNVLQRKQEVVQECEVNMICSQLEACWQKRDWHSLLALVLNGSKANVSFLPHIENKNVVALEHFLASKNPFIDKMRPDDQCGLQFLLAVIKIHKQRFSDALLDLERLAYKSHYHIWLGRAIADLLLGVITDNYSLFFPSVSLNQVVQGELLMDESDDDRFSFLFPRNSELNPPFASNWPELGVVGLSTRGHIKFEKAVAALLDKGQWEDWDAAMAYINYVPGCIHPAEAAFCFLYSAMFLLKKLKKQLGSSTTPALSEVFATKNMVMNCIQSSMSRAIRYLHPGMQFYVCRLCLGTAMQTMQLTDSLAVEYEAILVTTLLHLTIYSSRFCPVWYFPSIPLSEVVLLNIKSGRYHLKFLLDLQYVEDNKRPVRLSEILYQLYANHVRRICCLEDPLGVRACAMENMLQEKGWTWNDVVKLMTSSLSPRDSEGWLIQQEVLGHSMPFAKLTGLVFNINKDSPSIEIVAVPADPSNGLIGLFSMEDVQTILQLAAKDAYPILFSLDPPTVHQKYHPFQNWQYKPKELQNSLFLQTLFEADYLLKSFSVGAEVSAKPPFLSRPCSEGLTKNIPHNLLEMIKPVSERGRSSPHVHRFWIQADVIEYNIKETGSRLEFELGEPQMNIRSHPIVPGPDGKFRDAEFEDDPNSPEAKFASDFTSHYNQVGKYFPIFARLRELAKLRTLAPILHDIKRNLKDKADGKGLRVPHFLLTEVQEDARRHNQERVDNILKNLDSDIGVWPTAEDQSKVASKVKHIMDNMPSHQKHGATYQAIEPDAKKVLKEEDEEVLNIVTSICLEACEQRLSKDDLKRLVHCWLLFRNASTSTELKNLVCSVIPLPTNDDIIRHLIQPHHQAIYSAFEQKLDSVTSSATHNQDSNPCMWVPTAAVTDEDNIITHYGGVRMLPRLLRRRLRSEASSAESVPVVYPTTSVPTLVEISQRLLSVAIPAEPIETIESDLTSSEDCIPEYAKTPSPVPKGPFSLKPQPESTEETDDDSVPSQSADSQTNTTVNEPEDNQNASAGSSEEDNIDNESSCNDRTGSNQCVSSNSRDCDSDSSHDPNEKLSRADCAGGVDSNNRSSKDWQGDTDSTNASSRDPSDVKSHSHSLKNRKPLHLDNSVNVNAATCDGDEQDAKFYFVPSSNFQSESNGCDDDIMSQDSTDPITSYVINENDPSDVSIQNDDTKSNDKNDSVLFNTISSHDPPPPPDDQFVSNQSTESSNINCNPTMEADTVCSVYDLNPVLRESSSEWHHPGYGMKALCYGENLVEKTTTPEKLSHRCPMYTSIRRNSTQKKYEELISIEKAGRRRMKRLFFNFSISHNLTSDVSEPTSDSILTEKVGARGSAFLATIDKKQKWISFATEEYGRTAKASRAVKETNRLANANGPCGQGGCQCCTAMAQSNVCADNQGCQVYRAELTKEVNCRSSNVVYLIKCRRSGKSIHIGQTKEELHECINQYRTRQGSIVYQHFTSEGYSFEDMEVTILADIDDDEVRQEKEVQWRKKLMKNKIKDQRKRKPK